MFYSTEFHRYPGLGDLCAAGDLARVDLVLVPHLVGDLGVHSGHYYPNSIMLFLQGL